MTDYQREGVIKFDLDFRSGPSPAPELLGELNAWRTIFCALDLLGQDPLRYDGLGFGNLSCRLPERSDSAFIISGTQTGALEMLKADHYATVERCDPFTNQATAFGAIKPSSEALSHGILYNCCPQIDWVMHLHSPDIFAAGARLQLPSTSPEAAYGTPEMATEISQLAQTMELSVPNLLVMSGHADGILAFGREAEPTGLLAIRALIDALQVL